VESAAGIHWRNHKIPGVGSCDQALRVGICKRRMRGGLGRNYNEFLNLGGDKVSPAVWLELCRVPEQQQIFDVPLASTRSSPPPILHERQSLMAQLAPPESALKRLNRPVDALRILRGCGGLRRAALRFGTRHPIGNSGAKDVLSQVKATLRWGGFREMSSRK